MFADVQWPAVIGYIAVPIQPPPGTETTEQFLKNTPVAREQLVCRSGDGATTIKFPLDPPLHWEYNRQDKVIWIYMYRLET